MTGKYLTLRTLAVCLEVWREMRVEIRGGAVGGEERRRGIITPSPYLKDNGYFVVKVIC
jgi:hypothetical protein